MAPRELAVATIACKTQFAEVAMAEIGQNQSAAAAIAEVAALCAVELEAEVAYRSVVLVGVAGSAGSAGVEVAVFEVAEKVRYDILFLDFAAPEVIGNCSKSQMVID